MATKYEDFGEKIGGARKDEWKGRGLNLDDLQDMTDREAAAYVTKANVWPTPDYAEMVKNGMPISVAYFRKKIRDALGAKPKMPAEREKYITTVQEVREIVESVTTTEDAVNAQRRFFIDGGYVAEEHIGSRVRYCYTPKGSGNRYVTGRLFRAMYTQKLPEKFDFEMSAEAERKDFLAKKSVGAGATRKGRTRKVRYTPPQLDHIARDGEDYRNGRDVQGTDYLETFGFRGGEYGNWLNENDRRENMNMAYDALQDLAAVLGIDPTNIALDGSLAIAFGARGKGGNAVAHYEPMRKVINLTKMRGAGSLAHEWWHALDDFLGHLAGKSGMLSEDTDADPLFEKLVNTMKYDHGNCRTEYYEHSVMMDRVTAKDGGYWKSMTEMTARAFACYVLDRLPNRSDYLVGHAECATGTKDGEKFAAYPEGEERERINAVFDEIFADLRERRVFSRTPANKPTAPEKEQITTVPPEFGASVAGLQMSLF